MAKTQKTVPTRRNLNLDLIKLLSCLAVIGLHTTHEFDCVLGSVLYQLFIFAVPCFYMASGYLLLSKRSVSWGYALKKVLRIIRLVVAWCVIVCTLDLIGTIVRRDDENMKIMAFLRSCIANAVKSVLQKGKLWQFWYLGSLILIYLLLPLLHRMTAGMQHRRLVAGWCVVAAVCVLLQTVSAFLGQSLQNKVPQTFRMWTTLQYFLLGGLVRVRSGQIQDRLPLKLHTWLAAVAALLTLLWRLFLDSKLGWGAAELYYDDPFTILWIGLFFTLLMRVELGRYVSGVADRMAPLIMGVYVIHVPVRNLIRDTFTITGTEKMLLYITSVTGISFVVAYFVSQLPWSKVLLQI